MKQTHEFEATESLVLENSFGTIREQSDVKLHITVGINSEDYGWFEIYDIESGGNEWYAEGGLWFDGKIVTEYDGVFSLPSVITDKLIELGYDVSEVVE